MARAGGRQTLTGIKAASCLRERLGTALQGNGSQALSEYEAASDRLRAAHWELQSIRQQLSPDKMVEEAARQRVEQAMDVYRACRTNIADFLLSGQPAGSQHRGIRTAGIDRRAAGSKDSAPGCGDEVQVLAHRLWEDAGRPMGSADALWYRAEEILRSGR